MMSHRLFQRCSKNRLEIRRQQLDTLFQQKRTIFSQMDPTDAKDLLRTCGRDLLGILAQGTIHKEQLMNILAKMVALAGQYEVWDRLSRPEILVNTERNLLPQWLEPKCSVIDLVIVLTNEPNADEQVIEEAMSFLSLLLKQDSNQDDTNSAWQINRIAHYLHYPCLLSPSHKLSQSFLSIIQALCWSCKKHHKNILYHIVAKTPTISLLCQLAERPHLQLSDYARQYSITSSVLVSFVCYEKLQSVNNNFDKLCSLTCRVILLGVLECNFVEQKAQLRRKYQKIFMMLYKIVPSESAQYPLQVCKKLEHELDVAMTKQDLGYVRVFAQLIDLWDHRLQLSTVGLLFRRLLSGQSSIDLSSELVQILHCHIVNKGTNLDFEDYQQILKVIQQQGGNSLVYLHRHLRQDKKALNFWMEILYKFMTIDEPRQELSQALFGALLEQEQWNEKYQEIEPYEILNEAL